MLRVFDYREILQLILKILSGQISGYYTQRRLVGITHIFIYLAGVGIGKSSRDLKGKSMANKLMYISNDDTPNYPVIKLELVVETFQTMKIP